MSKDFFQKYPLTKKFLEASGMTLDQALIFTEIEIKKLERGMDGKFISKDKNFSD